MNTPVDRFRKFLESIGFDASVDPQLAETPERVCAMLDDLFSSVGREAPKMSVFEADEHSKGPVLVMGMPFRSMCVHHFVPFFGTIDVAYLPDEQISGFGSFGRIVEWASRRPQIQERMVGEIAAVIEEQVNPMGLIVRCRARQMCVEMRSGRPGTYVSIAASGALAAGAHLHDSVLHQLAAGDRPL